MQKSNLSNAPDALEVRIPDIGDVKDLIVIEVLVKAGDIVQKDQSIITIESDKWSMEIPSSESGVVKEVKVRLGDKVNEGSIVLLLDSPDRNNANLEAVNCPPLSVYVPLTRQNSKLKFVAEISELLLGVRSRSN